MADLAPPRLVSTTPPAASKGQSLWFDGMTLFFSEPLAFGSITSNSFRLVSSTGDSVPARFEVDTARQWIRVSPAVRPLKSGQAYTVYLMPGITDEAGNPCASADGSIIADNGLGLSFTTAGILRLDPTNAASVVQGQQIQVSAQYEAGLGADSFRFILNTNAPVDVPVSPSPTNAIAFLRIPGDAHEARIAISARLGNETPAAVGELVLNVQLRNPNNSHRPPVLDAMPTVYILRGMATNITITAHDTDGNIEGLRVSALPLTTNWQSLRWKKGDQVSYAQVVGGFDKSRAGEVALLDGSLAAEARAGITNNMPLAVLAAAPELTASFLDTVDMVMLASPSAMTGSAITPLTVAEKQALLDFVGRGGIAYLLAAGDSFAGAASAPANASLLDPFGLHDTGSINNPLSAATVVDPGATAWTSGRYGFVSNYTAFYPGWFDNLGPYAQVVARLTVNNQPTLALIEAKALAPDSGPVFLSSSAVLPESLMLNAMDMSGMHSQLYDFSSSLRLLNTQNSTSQVQIVAFDLDSLSVTQQVNVVTVDQLPDLSAGIFIGDIALRQVNSFTLLKRVDSLTSNREEPSAEPLVVSEIVLSWTARPEGTFLIEKSADLVHWQTVPSSIQETGPGRYESHWTHTYSGWCFFRIR